MVRTEYIPVPDRLVTSLDKTVIPDTLTYGQALSLWVRDRATIDDLNGQLQAIRKLVNDGE